MIHDPRRRHSPAAERNKDPILETLRPLLAEAKVVVEVASGTGQHAAHLAGANPHLTWYPTDGDPEALESVAAWTADLEQVQPPQRLDVISGEWPVSRADLVYCANMVHIAPWPAAEGLMAGAGAVLQAGGHLCLYGPYKFEGAFTSASNAEFDASLRGRDPRWGIRDAEALDRLAEGAGMRRIARHDLPANNHVLIYQKRR